MKKSYGVFTLVLIFVAASFFSQAEETKPAKVIPATITGHVYDAETKQPLTEGEVVFYFAPADKLFPSEDEKSSRRASIGQDGSFSIVFSETERQSDCHVQIDSPHYVCWRDPISYPLSLFLAEDGTFSLSIVPAYTVTGEVCNENESPIAEADIHLLKRTKHGYRYIYSTKSDKTGKYRVRNIPHSNHEEYYLSVKHLRFMALQKEIRDVTFNTTTQSATLPLRLAAGMRIEGTAKRSDGSALANARVHIVSPGVKVIKSVITDKYGHFKASGLAAGESMVIAENGRCRGGIKVTLSDQRPHANVEVMAPEIVLDDTIRQKELYGIRFIVLTDALRKKHLFPEGYGTIYVLDTSKSRIRLIYSELRPGDILLRLNNKNLTNLSALETALDTAASLPRNTPSKARQLHIIREYLNVIASAIVSVDDPPTATKSESSKALTTKN